MTLNYFGKDNSLATATDGKTEVSGKIFTSYNKKHSVILGTNNEPKVKNLAMVVNTNQLTFACIDKPISAVITDNGLFAITTVDLDKNECGLIFFDAEGKKIKKLKSGGTSIFLSPDSKYIITQNLPDGEKSIDRILTVYDATTLQKTMKTLNPLYDADFSFIDNSTLRLSYGSDAGTAWKNAELNISYTI